MGYLVPNTTGRESCSDKRMENSGPQLIRPLISLFVYFVYFVFIIAFKYLFSVTFCRGL